MENAVKDAEGLELETLVDYFEEAEDSNTEARDVSMRCRDYYNGRQLTQEEKAELKKRGKPEQIYNHIRSEINTLLGVEMQSRTDPRAFPREPDADQGAEAATDALRYVCDNTDWAKTRSKCYGDLLIEGMCGVEVVHREKKTRKGTETEIVIQRYSFDRLFFDPHSADDDFDDARYKGAVVWSDMDALIRQYPDKEEMIEGSIGPTDTAADLFEDKPSYKIWSDPKRRRTRVVLMHYLHEGQWHYAKFCKGGILEDGVSMYLDEDGNPECPLILQSMYVGVDNDRHGTVLDMLSPQDGVNKRHSKLLHQLNSRQTMGVKGAVDSVKAMKRELASPDGHVELNIEAFLDAMSAGQKPFEMLQTQDQTAGQFNLLQEAKAELTRQGANGAMSGKNARGNSGRAIMAEQQAGMTETSPLIDQLSHFTVAVYRAIWNRVRQFWNEEKWIRITDDDRNVRFVGLNKPVTVQDKLSEMPPEDVAMFARANGIGPGDPRLTQVVDVENRVEDIDVDIVLDEVPDSVTLEGETFEQLIGIATSMPGSVPPSILIEAAPGIDRKIKDKLLEMMEQQQAQQSQVQGQAMQIDMASKDADIKKTQSEAAKNMATAQKTMVEASMPRAI